MRFFNWSFQLGVAFAVCAVIIFISSPDRLEIAAKLAEIALGLSAVIAAFTYFFEKQKDEHESVAQQIRLFRTEALDAYTKLGTALREKGVTTAIPRIEQIEEFSFPWLFKYKRIQASQQQEILNKVKDVEGGFLIIQPLNVLEELSAHMITRNTVMSENLICIRLSFIQIVESLATFMTDWIEVDAKNMYRSTRKVYGLWRNSVDRTPPAEIRRRNDEEKAKILAEEARARV